MSDFCAHGEEMMRPYLDHVLTDEEIALAEAHLAECVDCRRRYRFEAVLRIYVGQYPNTPESEGGMGVREPRRPTPTGSSDATALPMPSFGEAA